MALCPWTRFVKVAALGDVAVVELSDVLLSAAYAPWLFVAAQKMAGRHIHLDCDDVKSFSSEALATLLLLQQKVKESGGRLRLFNLGPDQFEVIAASRLTKLLDARRRAAE